MTFQLKRHRLRAGVILAVVGLISIFIASSVAAATLDSALVVVTDGTAPFEDWAPGDNVNSGPTGDSVNDPGDDLDGNNGVVRTGDTVLYRAAWSINDSAATNVIATITLGGDADAYFDINQLPPGTCKAGSGVSPDGQTLTCIVGSAGIAETFSLDLPVVVTYASEQGDLLNASIEVTADASAPSTATSVDTEVSAAPRWDLRKVRSGGESIQQVDGVYGFSNRWRVIIEGGDTDPRGNSALAQPITFTDHLYWSDPGQTSSGTVLLDRNENIVNPSSTDCLESGGGSITHSCAQSAPGGDITWTFDNIDFEDINPGATGGTALSVEFDTFTPFTELELLNDADPTNNVGDGVLQNDVGLADPTDPDNSATLWDPVDSTGISNWGSGTEDPSNNDASEFMELGTGRSIDKAFTPRRSIDPARVVDNAEIRANARFDTGTNTAELTNPIICDKFDNSRFVLRELGISGQAATVSQGNDNSITFVIQYGANNGWGAYTPPNDGSDDGTDWYTQNVTQCGDGDATNGWFTGAQVDWDNAGGASINAEDVNMVRVKVTGIVRPGTANRINLQTNWTVLDNDSGEYLINSSAFFDDTNGWATSTCTGASGTSCPTPPQWNNDARPGARSDIYQQVQAPVYIRKEVCENVALDGCTDTSVFVAPGDVVPFFLYPQVSTQNLATNEPALPATGANASNVVVTDVLPVNISYVANSSFVDGVPQEPDTIQLNTPGTGKTTLTWNLGSIPFNTVREITFNGEVSAFAANNVSLQNNVEIESPDDPSNSQFHSDAVGVVPLSSSIARVGKQTIDDIVDLDTPIQWELGYGNLSSTNVEFADLVDILPYNGDPQGTSFNGTFELTSVTGPFSYPLANGTANPVEIWISSVDPATLDALDGSADGLLEPVEAYGSFFAGTGNGTDFPCQIAAAGTGSCPALSAVTAIRILGLDPDSSNSGPGDSFLAGNEGPHYLTLTMTPTNNELGDFYGNKWGGRFEGLPLPVWSPAVAGVRTPNLVLGDLVWFDTNNNGTYEPGTDLVPPPGVLVNLLDGSGNPVLGSSSQPITTTTDSDGRYFFDKLEEGTYIVEIDASNFAVGGPLEAATASTNNVDTGVIADNDNEGTDHNASFVQGNGAVRSGQVNLTFGTGPLGDNTGGLPINAVDADTNLTIDFAFDPPPRDYGDLPDTGSGTGAGNYETLAGSNGPSHIVGKNVRLGALNPDDEPDGQPSSAADGDDNNGANDEDGLVFLTPLVPGTTAEIQVTTFAQDGSGNLSLFIDFNGDGDFDDPGETVLADQAYTNGTRTILVNVPADATGAMGVRARFTDGPNQGGASPVGPGSFGEIEDYILAGLGDFVWEDLNDNGLQDNGEPGVNGTIVNLLDGSGNPVLDSNGDPITTVTMNDPDTNEPGYYTFPGLLPGNYIVEFIPVGRDITLQNADGQGIDGAVNSDPNPATGRTPVITLDPGEYNPNIDAGLSELLTACPVPGNELTVILGSGMGNNQRGRKAVRVNIPDYQNVTELYAQYAGKDNDRLPKRVRFMTSVDKRIDVQGPTSYAYRKYAVYLYSTEMEPARWAKVRVWIQNVAKLASQRALIVYPTYTLTEEYSNVWRTFEESTENHVYWENGWYQEQTFVAQLPTAPLTAVTIKAQAALVEDDDDGRPIILTVTAGGVTQQFVEYKSRDRDMLTIIDIELENVPAGTEEVVFHLYSPGPFESGDGWQTGEDGGDSVSIVGIAANYECALP